MTQLNLNSFQERVEEKTKELENNPLEENIKAIYNHDLENQTVKEMIKIWDSSYELNFDKFLDICLAVLENREEDYMNLIKGMKKDILLKYNKLFGILLKYFTYNYNYGDPLGIFYMQIQSHGRNGEYYTPYNICYMMAKILNPKPTNKVCDPAVGSGAMLLATKQVIHEKYGWIESSKFGRNLYGMDVSHNAVRMSKIQMYLTDYIYMSILIISKTKDILKKDKL